jgi:WD40 repeat protein
LDNLLPALIPAEERCAGMPAQVVAVIGSQRGRHWGPVNCVAQSPDGKLIVSASRAEDCIRVRDATTLREVKVLQCCKEVSALVFSADGRWLAACGDATSPGMMGPFTGRSGWVSAWEITNKDGVTFTPLFLELADSLNTAGVLGLAFSPDGTRLEAVLAGTEGMRKLKDFGKPVLELKEWHMLDGKLTKGPGLRSHDQAVLSAAFSADGLKLASGSESTIVLWELRDIKPTPFEPFLNSSMIIAIGLFMVAALFLIALRSAAAPLGYPWIKSILGWATALLAVSLIICLAISLYLWDLNRIIRKGWQGEDVETPSRTTALVFTPDCKTLASGSLDGKVRLWAISEGKLTQQSTLDVHSGAVNDLALSADGRRLASAGADGTIWLWDVGAEELLQRAVLRGHIGEAWSVAFSADGKTLVSGGMDTTVRLWDLSADPPKEKLRSPGQDVFARSIEFAVDGRLAVGCADNTLRFYDLGGQSPVERRVMRGLPGIPWKLALTRDLRTLAIGYSDRSARLYDLDEEEPKERAVIQPAKQQESSEKKDASLSKNVEPWHSSPNILFFPDGKTLRINPRTVSEKGHEYNAEEWDLQNPLPRRREVPSVPGDGMILSPDGRALAGLVDHHLPQIAVWELGDVPRELGRLQNESALRSFVGFVLNGETVTGVSPENEETILASYDLKTSTRKGSVVLEDWKGVWKGIIYTTGYNWGYGLWNGALSPDGRTVAAANLDQHRIVVWSFATGKKAHDFVLPGFSGLIACPRLVYSPDGRHLAVCNDNGTVYILRL